jgi:hypothetical protein
MNKTENLSVCSKKSFWGTRGSFAVILPIEGEVEEVYLRRDFPVCPLNVDLQMRDSERSRLARLIVIRKRQIQRSVTFAQ